MTASDYHHSIERLKDLRFGVGILGHILAVCLGLSAATVTEFPALPLQRLMTPLIVLVGNVFQLPFEQATLACMLGIIVLCEIASLAGRHAVTLHIRKLHWLTLGDDNQMYF